ncbi:PH domain-containing protein [Bacillus sp. Marseille-Q3570]|uniref:PH domain-containing protein n=1 Tax=Bacillus sp. Marseille-Q3570 TaxID=2963522 RepID=UPI0021B6E771|nr:PH domain-containing protein [Bacillus sp. Marseille-Q3570]
MFEPTRLHPLAAGLSFLKILREWIIPIIIFFIFGPGSPPGMTWVSFAPFLFILLLGGYGVLHWFRFTYHIEGEELKIEYGVFVRKKRYIPKRRIQSIDYTQGIFHRIFDVVKINIETAGGPGGAEASLSAVSLANAEQLKEALREEKTRTEEAEVQVESEKESPAYSYKLSLKDLLLAASTSGGIGVTLPLIGTLSSQFENFIPDEFYVEAFNWLSGFSWVVIAVMAFFSLLFAWFISFVGVILKYANFQIRRFEDRIVISRGLLEKRELTLPLHRVQGIRVVESVLRQPFGFATVHVESAGGAGPEMGVSAMLFPFIKRSKINSELTEILPDYNVPAKMKPLPKRAMRRYILRNVAPAIIVLPLFWVVPSQFWILLFIPVPILVMWGILDFKDSKWLIEGRSFYMQTRTLSRSMLITKKRRMQDFEIKQSIFQRRHELITVKTAILSGGVGKVFQLKDVETKNWNEAFGWFSRKSQESKLQ